ncbi:MAG TPA: T9SS type A sorting domain-containing protein [Chitinophagaceae bacterium]|nr:T9SS type A sorting domain-containing protein [Chitinophagaceae bacterium]
MKSFFLSILITVFVQASLAQSGNYWTQKSSLPDSAREYAIGFSINNKGYVGTGNKDGGNYLWDFWEYTPVPDVWTRKADFTPGIDSVGRRSASGFGIGNKGYIGPGVGQDTIPPTQGDTMYNDFWEYNVSTNLWTQKTILPMVGRQYYVAFSINGKGYIGTGETGGFSGVLLNDFWEYDTITDTWTQKASFGGTARYLAVGFSLLGKGYIGTGLDASNYRNDFWEYDPVVNNWIQKASLPIGVSRSAAIAFSIETIGRGYIGLGGGSSFFGDLREYNPITDTWTIKASFPGGVRLGASGFSIGNKGYVSCGSNGTTRYNDLWEYTPDSLTSVEEIEQLQANIYPNPSNGNFSISINEKEFNVTVYDVTGKMIYENKNEKQINLTTQPKGIYFLKITAEDLPTGQAGKTYSQKLIIQ